MDQPGLDNMVSAQTSGHNHEVVEATVTRIVQAWGRVDVLAANAGGGCGRPVDTEASTLDPTLLAGYQRDEPVRDSLFVQRRRPDHEAGKIITVSSVAGTALSLDSGYAQYGAAR
jgi:3-oxoacyl-[acyl-carrier protein] reductase